MSVKGLILLAVAALSKSQAEFITEAYYETEFEDNALIKGESATFICSYRMRKFSNYIAWRYQNLEVYTAKTASTEGIIGEKYEGRVEGMHDMEGRKLQVNITNFGERDIGEYSCVVYTEPDKEDDIWKLVIPGILIKPQEMTMELDISYSQEQEDDENLKEQKLLVDITCSASFSNTPYPSLITFTLVMNDGKAYTGELKNSEYSYVWRAVSVSSDVTCQGHWQKGKQYEVTEAISRTIVRASRISLVEYPRDVVSEGETVRAVCLAGEAYPTAEILWYINGIKITSEKAIVNTEISSGNDYKKLMSQYSFTVSRNKDDRFETKCRIRGVKETDNTAKSFIIRVVFLPRPPTGLTALNISSHGAVISWISDKNGGVDQVFNVCYKKVSSNRTLTETNTTTCWQFADSGITGTRMFYTLRGLHEESQYSAWVKTSHRFSSLNISSSSSTITFQTKTLPVVNDNDPLCLDDNRMILTWDAIAGEFTKLSVEICNGPVSVDNCAEVELDIDANRYELNGTNTQGSTYYHLLVYQFSDLVVRKLLITSNCMVDTKTNSTVSAIAGGVSAGLILVIAVLVAVAILIIVVSKRKINPQKKPLKGMYENTQNGTQNNSIDGIVNIHHDDVNSDMYVNTQRNNNERILSNDRPSNYENVAMDKDHLDTAESKREHQADAMSSTYTGLQVERPEVAPAVYEQLSYSAATSAAKYITIIPEDSSEGSIGNNDYVNVEINTGNLNSSKTPSLTEHIPSNGDYENTDFSMK